MACARVRQPKPFRYRPRPAKPVDPDESLITEVRCKVRRQRIIDSLKPAQPTQGHRGLGGATCIFVVPDGLQLVLWIATGAGP
jgi:hypothetical protein